MGRMWVGEEVDRRERDNAWLVELLRHISSEPVQQRPPALHWPGPNPVAVPRYRISEQPSRETELRETYNIDNGALDNAHVLIKSSAPTNVTSNGAYFVFEQESWIASCRVGSLDVLQ